jgi:putative two-component system response regulator
LKHHENIETMVGETLLIVEDNDILREGLHEMLGYEGFSVITARNGIDALNKMEALTPALILSDIAMPTMDGFAFLTAVRSRPEWVTIPFIFLTARVGEADILAGRNLGAEDYLTKPLSRDELVSTVRSRLGRSVQIKVGQLQQAYLQSLEILASAIDKRSPQSGDHSRRVTSYAMILANQLGWSERRRAQLRYGAILHDIGRINVPEAILSKDTLLTEEDLNMIHQHPITGAEMIRDVNFLVDIIPVVRHHHEHWDGSGYPDGLSGKDIPEGARIISVADSYAAMTAPRIYKPVLHPQEAFEELQNLSGKYYDPEVIESFRSVWDTVIFKMPIQY